MRNLPIEVGEPPRAHERDPLVWFLRVVKLLLTIVLLAVTLWQALGVWH